MTRTTLSILAVALVACANTAPVEGRLCPCAEGYTCCATDVCVPEGAACSVVEPPALDRGALPCTADDDINIDGSVDTHWVYHYDDVGNDIRDDGDDHVDGTIDQVFETTFDDSQQMVLFTETIDGTVDYRQTMTYDTLERISTEVAEFDDGTSERLAWTYTGMTATEDIDYDGDGVVDVRNAVQQNATGKPMTATATNADGTPAWTEVWTYSSAGDVIAHDRIDPDGTVGSHGTYTRDDAGRVVARTIVLRDGSTQMNLMNTWDSDGRLATQTMIFAGVPPSETTLHYTCH